MRPNEPGMDNGHKSERGLPVNPNTASQATLTRPAPATDDTGTAAAPPALGPARAPRPRRRD